MRNNIRVFLNCSFNVTRTDFSCSWYLSITLENRTLEKKENTRKRDKDKNKIKMNHNPNCVIIKVTKINLAAPRNWILFRSKSSLNYNRSIKYIDLFIYLEFLKYLPSQNLKHYRKIQALSIYVKIKQHLHSVYIFYTWYLYNWNKPPRGSKSSINKHEKSLRTLHEKILIYSGEK